MDVRGEHDKGEEKVKLYKGFSIRVVRNESDIYIVFPRIINFKRDDVLSVLVDYKSNGSMEGIIDVLSGKYKFFVTRRVAGNIAAVFYENNERYGECELQKEEVYDIPYEIHSDMEMSSVPFGDMEEEKFREYLGDMENDVFYAGFKVYICKRNAENRYEIADMNLQDIIDSVSSEEDVISFNIEGILFSQKNNEKGMETGELFKIPEEYIQNAEPVCDRKYILIVDASYPAIRIECNSILEAQIMLVKHREINRQSFNCGNLFLGDEYVGWIDENGDFHDKMLPEGRYNRLHGVLHESYDSYPEYVEIGSVHYMRLSVEEYELFCTQMDGNNRYVSDYQDKDAALYYSIEEQYIYPAESILRDTWTELDKETFDLFFIRENENMDFLFSEEILRIRAALEIKDICVLDNEQHVWILLNDDENRAFFTMFHAFMFLKKVFGYEFYSEFQQISIESEKARIEEIKKEINTMEKTRQDNGTYHIKISQLDAVLELVKKAEAMGGKRENGEIVLSELSEIITLERYVKEIKINSTFALGAIYENEELL